MPAQAGIQFFQHRTLLWVPAFAGTSEIVRLRHFNFRYRSPLRKGPPHRSSVAATNASPALFFTARAPASLSPLKREWNAGGARRLRDHLWRSLAIRPAERLARPHRLTERLPPGAPPRRA